MKLFLTRVCAQLGVVIVILTCIAVGRFVRNQHKVDKHFAVPEGTDVLVIGNSHAGCTFTEAPEFRDRVIWHSSMGFVFHYLRFLELERRGVLDRGIKAVIFDCDNSTLNCCSKKHNRENFGLTLPFSWRYVDRIPMSYLEIAKEVLLNAGMSFPKPAIPPPEAPDWTTWSPERKRSYMNLCYGKKDWYAPKRWDSDTKQFPKDLMARFDEMVLDIKARCEKRGIRLIFFAAPLTTETPDRVNPAVWEQVDNIKKRVLGLGCEYYDFRLAYPDTRFHDVHHLLRSTSYDFTKRFYTEILKLPVGE